MLVANPSLRFQCRAELIRVEERTHLSRVCLPGGEILSMPISSAYGSYQLDQERLAELEKREPSGFPLCGKPQAIQRLQPPG